MFLINLAHPLTGEQQAALETLAGQKVSRLIEQSPHLDPAQPVAPQVRRWVDELEVGAGEWQQTPLLVNLPALHYGAAAVLAELHGRCGYFPAMVRLRPVPGSLPPRYEVAEIVNLQALRDAARQRRRG